MSNKIKGVIFNIQRFSLHDGPGIRTLIFMKGCPLRCKWCSNPEGLSHNIEILCDHRKCIGCGICMSKCPKQIIQMKKPTQYVIDRHQCDRCGECVKSCPTGAKIFSGEEKTVAEVIEEIKRDLFFYGENEGGVTIGGGEMLAQARFSYEILKSCKDLGIHTAIETSGFGKVDDLLKITHVTDAIYFDIKAIDSNLHRKITGVDNDIIIENLKALDKEIQTMTPKPKLILRIPVIEGFNSSETNAKQISRFIHFELTTYDEVEILVFHNLGQHKYEQLDLTYELQGRNNAKAEDYTYFLDIFKKQGIRAKISKW